MNYSDYLKSQAPGSQMSKSAYDSLAPLNVPSKPLHYQTNENVVSSHRDPRLMSKADKSRLRHAESSPAVAMTANCTELKSCSEQRLNLPNNSVCSTSVSDCSSELTDSLLQGDNMLNFLIEQLNEIKNTGESQKAEGAKKHKIEPDTTSSSAKKTCVRVEESNVSKALSMSFNLEMSNKENVKLNSESKSEDTDTDDKYNVQINLKQPLNSVITKPSPQKTQPVRPLTPRVRGKRNPFKPIDTNRSQGQRPAKNKPFVEYSANFNAFAPASRHDFGSYYNNNGSYNQQPSYNHQEYNMGVEWPRYDENYDPGRYNAAYPGQYGNDQWWYPPPQQVDYWRPQEPMDYSAPLNSSTPLAPRRALRGKKASKAALATRRDPVDRRRPLSPRDRFSRTRRSRTRSNSRTRRRRSRTRSRRRRSLTRSRSRTLASKSSRRRTRSRSAQRKRRRSSSSSSYDSDDLANKIKGRRPAASKRRSERRSRSPLRPARRRSRSRSHARSGGIYRKKVSHRSRSRTRSSSFSRGSRSRSLSRPKKSPEAIKPTEPSAP